MAAGCWGSSAATVASGPHGATYAPDSPGSGGRTGAPSGGPPGGFGRTNFGPHHGGSLSTSRSCRAVGLHLARWGQKGPPASINRAWRASERALFNETRLQRGRIRAGHAIKKSIGNLSRCRTDDLEAQSLGHPGRNFGPETSDLSRHCDHGHGPLQSLNSIKGLLRRICGRF
jgi:hypothetical protein